MMPPRKPPPTLDAADWPEEPPTGVTCSSYGGNFQIVTQKPNGYTMRLCPHCTGGMMTPKQVAAWRDRKR